MLRTLTIKNIAVIDSVAVPFEAGLNILSGETGAGKSIVIEAISLLLGSRATAELIRTGCDEAVVEGYFDTETIPWMNLRLETLGFAAPESNELLIKRTVSRSGKNRIFINGQMATLSILQQLGEGLIDLCGQHEHQSLLKGNTQLELLDRFAGLEKEADAVKAAHKAFHSEQERFQELSSNAAERARQADFLRFQIEELRKADLQPGEEETLAAEKQLLQSAQHRLQLAEGARQALEEDEVGALNAIRSAANKLRSLHGIDERCLTMLDALERARIETEEVALQLNRYLGSIDLNADRLEEVQERLAMLADLRRKYGASSSEMLSTLSRLESEFGEIDGTEEKLTELKAQVEKLSAQFQALSEKLSEKRRKSAPKIASAVTAELKDLNMKDAEFTLDLSRRASPEEWNAQGADSLQFTVRTNRGEEPRPLGKIASGGELSRLMLAVRRVIADKGGIGVYLFDEIDAGIGGQTAFQVGRKLKSVASHNQVICITHLAQVAAFAANHLVVRKEASGKRTVTEVVQLSTKERREEIARMLGGPELTKKSLENAAEMLDLAQK